MRLLFPLLYFLTVITGLHSHSCQSSSIDVEIGQSTTYTVFGSLDASYEVPGTGGAEASITPLSIPRAQSGVFTISGNQIGVTFMTINWVGLEFDDAEGVCSFKVNVVPPPSINSGSNFIYSGSTGDPVNTFTGELYMNEGIDLNLGGPLPLVFSRYYSSFIKKDRFISSEIGTNWVHNFDLKARIDSSSIDIIYYKAKVIQFSGSSASGWTVTSTQSVPYQLMESGSDYVMLDPQLNRFFTFDSEGKLTQIEDTRGNIHQIIYDDHHIDRIEDGLGRILDFAVVHDQTSELDRLIQVSDGVRSVQFSHDTSGNLVSFTDPESNQTQYTYDSADSQSALMISRTRGRGNIPYSQEFDSEGRVVRQTDSLGGLLTLDFQDSNTVVTGPDGSGFTHIHANGALVKESSAVSGQVFMSSDSRGRRAIVTDSLGGLTMLSYHEDSGNLFSQTLPDGSTTNWTYTSSIINGFTLYTLSETLYPDGTREQFTYDFSLNMTSRVDRSGGVWQFDYNSRGQLVSETNPEGGNRSLTYNSDGTVNTRTDFSANLSTLSYDSLLRLNRITHPDENFRSYTYNGNSQVLSITDEEGQLTSYTYDANRNLALVTYPSGQSLLFTYDGLDRPAEIRDADGNKFQRSFDSAGNLTSLTDPLGNTNLFQFSSSGKLLSATDAVGNTWRNTYDSEQVLLSLEDPSGNRVDFSSDSTGNLTSTSLPDGARSQRVRDVMGEVVTHSDGKGFITTYTFDSRGLLRGMRLPGGEQVSLSRNRLGQITSVVDPLGNLWQKTFDPAGRLASRTDPSGNALSFTYDSRNRTSSLSYPGQLGTVELSYDKTGNLESKSYSAGLTITYSYGLGSKLTGSDGLSLGYNNRGLITNSNGIQTDYDAAGRLQTITLEPGKTLAYVYNSRSQIASITDWTGASVQFGYGQAGELNSLTRSNGIQSILQYNSQGQVSSINVAGSQTLATMNLKYNHRGFLESADRNLPVTSTLTSSSTSFSHGSRFDINSGGAVYDALGRMTSDDSTTYGWDAASRLVSSDTSSSNRTYTYDGSGMLLGSNQSSGTLTYTWNYAFPLPSMSVMGDGDGNLRYFAYAPDGSLYFSIDQNGSHWFYHYDETGNVLFLTDDNGDVIGGYQYDPYGESIAATAPQSNPFRYGGKHGIIYTDGLYFMRSRFYHPQIARFLSPDPARAEDPIRVNLYQYARSNPLKYVDPLGDESYEAQVRARIEGSRRDFFEKFGYDYSLKEDDLHQEFEDVLRTRAAAKRAALLKKAEEERIARENQMRTEQEESNFNGDSPVEPEEEEAGSTERRHRDGSTRTREGDGSGGSTLEDAWEWTEDKYEGAKPHVKTFVTSVATNFAGGPIPTDLLGVQEEGTRLVIDLVDRKDREEKLLGVTERRELRQGETYWGDLMRKAKEYTIVQLLLMPF